jgi:hypothetical protein
MTSERPPELLSISQCNKTLEFDCLVHWPEGLPAVAINRTVIAGFGQELVFNHGVDPEETDAVVSLFTSIYPRLSFLEVASLTEKAAAHSWVPLRLLQEKWGFHWNDGVAAVARRALALPRGFRHWLIEKRVGPQDLQILLESDGLRLEPLLYSILSARMGRNQGLQALKTGIRQLRAGTEEGAASPWQAQSQLRWVRRGDRAGLELKIFVSNPSDLKKSVQKIQDLLDENSDVQWMEQ